MKQKIGQRQPWLQVKDFLESFGQLKACKMLPRGPGNAADLSVYCAYDTLGSTTAALQKLSDIKVSSAHSQVTSRLIALQTTSVRPSESCLDIVSRAVLTWS